MKQTQTGIAIALALVVVAVFLGFQGRSPLGSTEPPEQTVDISQTDQTTMPTESSDQLKIVDAVVGTGPTAETGDTVTVRYVGKFTDGKVFDASANHSADGFTFTIGVSQVIDGWHQGLPGMKVGGKRLLVIPPSLAYGAADHGPIPGNSTLVFDIELVSVQKASR